MKHAQCHTVQQDHQHGRTLEPCGQQLRNTTAENDAVHIYEELRAHSITTSRKWMCISLGFLQWPHYPIQVYKLHHFVRAVYTSLKAQFTFKIGFWVGEKKKKNEPQRNPGSRNARCGWFEWQSLLPFHPVKQRSVCKVCWKMFRLLVRKRDRRFKEAENRQQRQEQRDRGGEDEASGFRVIECGDILMHGAWILLTTGLKWGIPNVV